MSNKNNELKVLFCGGNSYDVTGSMILLEWNGRKILLDCGIIQGGTLLQNYKDNRAMLTKNKLKNVEMVIVGELHADHECNIPYLTKVNPSCRIITPIHHKKIFKCMWEDSVKISERDCEVLSKQYSDKQFVPNYNIDDVNYAVERIEEYSIGNKVFIDDDITIRFSYSGHIFSCCQVELWINVNGNIKNILYTADLGNTINSDNRPFTENLQKVSVANLVISESTYGKREYKQCTKKTINKDIEKLYSVIDQYAITMKSRVLIPTFSLDRAPAMLYMIWNKFKDNPNFDNVKVILDSPLMNKLLDIYIEELDEEKSKLLKEILQWKNVIRVITAEESKFVMEHYDNAIIIASSGMCTIGRSKLWLKKILPNANCCCILSGYCSPNTIGAKLKDNKQKTIMIDGKSYANRCNIVNILGQSSHIQRNELMNYLLSINCNKICLVHGNMNGRIEFAEDLKTEIQKCSKTTKICVVNKGTRISL